MSLKEKIQEAKLNGLNRRLIAFTMEERGIPRPGYKVYHDDNKIGFVTSKFFFWVQAEAFDRASKRAARVRLRVVLVSSENPSP